MRLLQARTFAPFFVETNRPKLPAILLSRSTQKLLEDIFQAKDLFAGFPEIRTRRVAWSDRDPVALPHFGVVASEQLLLERLWARIDGVRQHRTHRPDYTIITARDVGILPAEKHFGTRQARVRDVELKGVGPQDACWTESVEEGWLFLLPTGYDRGCLITVGAEAEALLGKSRLIASQIGNLGETTPEFPVYPRILSTLCDSRWLACGTAAMSFDPLCGEGAGNAAREAILACAALRAICDGEPPDEVRAEYSLRLLLGFYKHLDNCKNFYRIDSPSAFWSSELVLLEEGIAWTRQRLKEAPKPRFRLVGFGLERIDDDPGVRFPDH